MRSYFGGAEEGRGRKTPGRDCGCFFRQRKKKGLNLPGGRKEGKKNFPGEDDKTPGLAKSPAMLREKGEVRRRRISSAHTGIMAVRLNERGREGEKG